MQSTKSLKVTVFILLLVVVVILSGCGGTTPPINHSPTIVSLTANPPSPIETNQSTVITCSASDPAGDLLTYTWSKTGGTITGTGSAITWTPTATGSYNVTVEVSDGSESATQSFTITVNKALLISIEVLPVNMTLEIGDSKTIDSITAHYSDDTETIITPLSACTYESDKPSVATVNSDGVITGISSCTASTLVTITVTYIENSIPQTDTISVVVTNPSPG